MNTKEDRDQCIQNRNREPDHALSAGSDETSVSRTSESPRPRVATVVIDGRVIRDHFPGIGRYVYELARALAAFPIEDRLLDDGREIRFVLLRQPGQDAGRFELDTLCGTTPDSVIRCADVDANVFGPAAQWKIPTILRKLEADVYHSTFWTGPFRAGRPTLLTLYDFIGERIPNSVPSPKSRVLALLMRLSIRGADRFISISEAATRDMQDKGIDRSRITISPLAADERFAPASAGDIQKLRDRFDLSHDLVLYLGINKPHKNLEVLIRAWAEIRKRGAEGVAANAELVIAGAWDPRYPEAKELMHQMAVEESVRFIGQIDEQDLATLYSAASVFAFPSRYEGFGLPPLEAMACGTPAVVSCASSLPEVVGDAGICLDPDDHLAWASTLVRYLEDRDFRLEQARLAQYQAGSFSWERTAQATLDAYKILLSGDSV